MSWRDRSERDLRYANVDIVVVARGAIGVLSPAPRSLPEARLLRQVPIMDEGMQSYEEANS